MGCQGYEPGSVACKENAVPAMILLRLLIIPTFKEQMGLFLLSFTFSMPFYAFSSRDEGVNKRIPKPDNYNSLLWDIYGKIEVILRILKQD